MVFWCSLITYHFTMYSIRIAFSLRKILISQEGAGWYPARLPGAVRERPHKPPALGSRHLWGKQQVLLFGGTSRVSYCSGPPCPWVHHEALGKPTAGFTGVLLWQVGGPGASSGALVSAGNRSRARVMDGAPDVLQLSRSKQAQNSQRTAGCDKTGRWKGN